MFASLPTVLQGLALTVKVSAKNTSEDVVCCIFLLTVSIEANHVDPDQTAPKGAV